MCNLLVKKEIFMMLGGCWKDSGEDLYFLLKLLKAGYKIKYSPQLKINHVHPKKNKGINAHILQKWEIGR
jgi:GT2 family glycosyltransferase